MPHHFTQISRIAGNPKSSVRPFEATGAPQAKHACRKAWERISRGLPGRLVTVELRKRSTWALTSELEDGELIGVLRGAWHVTHKPDWEWK